MPDELSSMEQFASDNYSGICPEAWLALAKANKGHAPSYGNDSWTARAAESFRTLFETDCEVFFVFNGTAANSLALSALCHSYHSVICSDTAHVETDECGAPEFFSNGSKLLTARTSDGKLDPKAISELATKRQDIHYPRPRVVTITQATETGRVYAEPEIRAISDVCKSRGLALHMDGARFANACASMKRSAADISWKAGVDVLCFGGTKNGMPIGEAVVFFDKELANEFDYRCKQAGQLASKMRFLAAPWGALLDSGAWLRNAQHANACALYFSNQVSQYKHVAVLAPIEANSVFLSASVELIDHLRYKGWQFYTFIGGAARFMFSWDSTRRQIDLLVKDIADYGRPTE